MQCLLCTLFIHNFKIIDVGILRCSIVLCSVWSLHAFPISREVVLSSSSSPKTCVWLTVYTASLNWPSGVNVSVNGLFLLYVLDLQRAGNLSTLYAASYLKAARTGFHPPVTHEGIKRELKVVIEVPGVDASYVKLLFLAIHMKVTRGLQQKWLRGMFGSCWRGMFGSCWTLKSSI